MIGYGTGKIILKLPPFWFSNEEPQEHENKKQTNTAKCNITLNFHALDISRSIGRKAGISK